MAEGLALAPTSEPVASGTLWNDGGVITLSVGLPPVISVQPSAITVYEGQVAAFTISGTRYSTLKWQKQESGAGAWSDISVATSTIYITGATSVASDNTDKYRCVLTGEGGTTTSSEVALTVLAATPLDISNLGTALAAYGPFRKLRAAYSGSAIKVRRSSDNTEQDIGFSGNVLDTATLLTFCGAGNGFVTTVYDQSGNTNHQVQTTTANQPQIVSSGALMLHSFRASLVHDTTDRMATSGNLAIGSSPALTGVLSYSAGHSADKRIFTTGSNAATQAEAFFASDNGPGTGKHRTGISSGSATFNLWDYGTNDLTRLVRGSILDRALSAALEVVPIRGNVAATTGYTQTLNTNMSGNFAALPLGIGDTGNAMRWDTGIVYARALAAADAVVLAQAIGAGSEGVSIGDSTIAAYLGTTAVGQYIYTDAERCSRPGIHELANPGDTIAQQKTAWTAYPHKLLAKWVCVQIGLNDTDPAIATATTIAALQDLITTIRAGVSSSCKIVMMTMNPIYNRFVTLHGASAGAALTKWRAMNEAIMGRGTSAITSVDARTEDHTTALTTLVSGNETLNASYDTGDGVHENNAGRQIVAAAWRDAIESLGLI